MINANRISLNENKNNFMIFGCGNAKSDIKLY